MLLFALEILRWGFRKLLSLPQPRGIQAQVDTLLATSPWKVWQIGAVELISGMIVLLAAGFVGGLLLLSVLCHFKGISFTLSYSLPTPWLFWDFPGPLDWQLNQLFRFFRLLLGYVDHAQRIVWKSIRMDGISTKCFGFYSWESRHSPQYDCFVEDFGRSVAFWARRVSRDNLLPQIGSRITRLQPFFKSVVPSMWAILLRTCL